MANEFLEPEEPPLSDAEAPNAASPTAVREARTKALRAKGQAAEFWAKVLADPIGRREIWRLLSDAGTFDTEFCCGPNGFPQPEATWFKAGKKDFGQRLFMTLSIHARAGVFQMLDEHDPRYAKPYHRKG